MQNTTNFSGNIMMQLEDKVSIFFRKRFNTIRKEDENSIEFNNPEKSGFVPTQAEIQYVTDLMDEGAGIEQLTVERLGKLGYGVAYAEAVKDLDNCWKEILKVPYSQKKPEVIKSEKLLLSQLQKRVYHLRNIADVNDEYLHELRQEWMGKHPSTKKFDRYARIMGLEPGSVAAVHAQMLVPACLIGKFVRSESAEAKNMVREDEANEVNRDDWMNFDVQGRDGRTRDKQKTDSESELDEIERKVLAQFKWLIEGDWVHINDVGAEMMLRYDDALFASDVITQRIYNAFGYFNEDIYKILMVTEDRIEEAEKKSQDREEWRDKVANGVIPSFDWDLYLCQFGRQKDIDWPQMGGRFKSAWGAKLQFECVSALDEDHRLICRNVLCYDDADKTADGQSSEASYKGAKARMFSDHLIRRKNGNPQYATQWLNWNHKLVELLLNQNPSFCIQVSKLEDKDLPEDKYGYNTAWYMALTEAIDDAKRHVENRAQRIVIDHDYSSLEDVYGEEGEALALECLLAIKKQALEAAAEQEKYINGREIIAYVEDDNCCEF